jgi:predicted RNA binding protein YcfA (HicA-like mRNA interferase family)
MPSPVRIGIVERALRRAGWSHVRTTGSHRIYEKSGEARHLCIPVHHGQVKHVYVRQIQKDYGIDLEA